ncbi:hypothetical protein D3C86_1738130 [compost metagenome]
MVPVCRFAHIRSDGKNPGIEFFFRIEQVLFFHQLQENFLHKILCQVRILVEHFDEIAQQLLTVPFVKLHQRSMRVMVHYLNHQRLVALLSMM